MMIDARLSGVAIARGTPHSTNYVYRLRSGEARSVSEGWMRGAIAAFPADWQPLVRACFTPLGERYTVKPSFWGLLAMRRIKYTKLAKVLPISQQRLSQLRSYPTYTIDEATKQAICRELSITVPERYFAAAPDAPSARQPAALEDPLPSTAGTVTRKGSSILAS
jgi:DNA-binding Xre family transcriptional regulator